MMPGRLRTDMEASNCAVTVGHQTCLAEAHFFTPPAGTAPKGFSLDREYEWAASLPDTRDPEVRTMT